MIGGLVNGPMLRRGLRRLRQGRAVGIEEVALRSWEICPAETVPTRPALHPPGAPERILRLSPWREEAEERALIRGEPARHAPTRAYLVGGAELAGSWVYRGAAKAGHGFWPDRLLLPGLGPCRHLPEAHLVSNRAGSRFFGNFLLDDFPLAMIPPAGAAAVALPTQPYPHEAGYRALLGLPAPERLRHARVERLTLYTDYAQNAFKKARYLELRARMRARFPGLPAGPGPLVYLKRGATGERRLVANEDALEALLAAAGFDIVEPARLEAAEIARRTLGARLVVGVEGSHLSHVIYTLAEGATLLVLQPPDRFAMAYKEFTDRMEMRFAFVVGLPAPDGFRVDLPELAGMLERLA